ncbi:MAG: DUF1456 family protein [Sphingobacteriaceae bacterium]|nr:DUF1456 family protein [Sphingobacteriaceae bacterium]
MTNNDILRRIRYTFDFNNRKMLEIFASVGYEAKPSQIIAWLQKDGDPDLVELNDNELAYFLNGFINEKRGKKEGEQPVPETTLNNNVIFRKLKIALNLKDTDILEIMKSVDLPMSPHELSAFFRKPDQKQFRICHDQFLRNFLHGMQLRYRPATNKRRNEISSEL